MCVRALSDPYFAALEWPPVVPRRAVVLVALAGCGRLGFDASPDGSGDGENTTLRIAAMALGNEVSCALSNRGQVKCWGANDWGKLGIGSGDIAPRGDDPGERAALAPVDLGTGVAVHQLSMQSDYACALLTDARVKCWGNNDGVQLGLADYEMRGDDPGEMGNELAPAILGAGPPVEEVATGHYHTCVRRASTVTCWGLDDVAQNGSGGQGPTDTPAEMLALVPVDLGAFSPAEIHTQFNATCVRNASGRVKCWGYNPNGELGLGDTETRGDSTADMGDALPFVDLGAGVVAEQLSCGWGRCCAITNVGLKCWGENPAGALGTGDVNHRGDNPGELGDALLPVTLAAPVVHVAAGVNHSCALLDDGTVQCFGASDRGQLGIGSTDSRGDEPGELGAVLPRVPLPEKAVKVFAGWATSCAILASGSVACWGKNDRGELGTGDANDRCEMPGDPPFITTAAELFP